MVTMDKQRCTFNVLRLSIILNGYKTSKYASTINFPNYHPLHHWLLGPTPYIPNLLHTPSTYPLCIDPPLRTPSTYPSVYPLCVPPLCTPPHTPSAYPLHECLRATTGTLQCTPSMFLDYPPPIRMFSTPST